jgi:hypothetical protein
MLAKKLRMNPNDRLADDDAGRFGTTHWSVVLLSAQRQVPGSRTALANLDERYWCPLYEFVQSKGQLRVVKTERKRVCQVYGTVLSNDS